MQMMTNGTPSPGGRVNHTVRGRDKKMDPAIIQAFKKQICKVTVQSASTLFTKQVFPLAWETAKALRYDPESFCLELGYHPSRIAEMARKGFISESFREEDEI